MKIELNLVLSLILEAVKAETYIKGKIDRAAQQGAEQVAYHETAGDDEVHERKLMRGIYTSSDKLRSWVQDYLSNVGGNVGDNDFKMSINETADCISFELVVSDRFNRSNNDALARTFSKYIEDNTLMLWWGTFDQKEAAYYQSLLTEDMNSIQRLFMKTAPKVPTSAYTKKIECGGELALVEGEDVTLSYVIDDGVIDDVDWACSRPRMLDVVKCKGVMHLYARHVGRCCLTLFSKHDTEVSRIVEVVIGRV